MDAMLTLWVVQNSNLRPVLIVIPHPRILLQAEDVDCDGDDESVSDVSGDESVSDCSGNEIVDDNAESDTASENDEVTDVGPFM